MNRRELLLRAEHHLGQAIEYLDRAKFIFEAEGEGDLLRELRKFEAKILDLSDAEDKAREMEHA